MDDISRESSPGELGAAPVSERQKGPEELVRFEPGHVGESGGDEGALGHENRLAGVCDSVHGDRASAAEEAPVTRANSGAGSSPADKGPDSEEVAARPVDDSGSSDLVDAQAARAAVDEEAHTASIEQDLDEIIDSELGDDGLPIVPELTEVDELSRVLFVLMLSSREGMSIFRLAQACNTTQKLVEAALDALQERLRGLGMPVELARVGDSVRWMSTASAFPYLQRLRGVKKLEKLSPAALETLAVIAYRQPVMRSEIEAIRGVKAGPMLRTLLQHKLVKVAGRADVPGRPLQYGTTPHFLERFGLASLQELPSVKEWKNLG